MAAAPACVRPYLFTFRDDIPKSRPLLAPMPGTGPAPEKKVSVLTMQIECPRCGEKMLVDIGLKPNALNNSVECVACRKSFVALVPGPIVRGPF